MNSENIFSDFILRKLGNAGGSIPLQHITGYMSQVSDEIRRDIGTSLSDIKQYFKRHPNLFSINNNVVSLINSSTLTASGYDSDNSSIGTEINLPPIINGGKGVIIKLFSTYGFIKSKDPIKAEIYFTASSFGKSDIDLTSILYTGSNVYFNAKIKTRNVSRSKYYATKVWKADNSKPEDVEIIQKSRKSRETGLYDPLTLDGEGVIQNVFPNLGFIAVNGDDNNTVFFYKSHVINYSNIVDLTKVFSKNDIVEFNAHRSTKANAKARWEATKVWKKSGQVQNACMPNSHSSCSSNSIQSVSPANNKAKELKKNLCGKISPRSHGAVIKFGKNELADGDAALYFINKTQVTEIGWEFSDGDEVSFDAVKIKSAPGWKAVLVWSGEKPDIVLPTCLGDFSQFTDEDNGESSIYTSKSSSCLSISSSSSLKSLSVKSESGSKKDLTKEKSSMLPDVVVSKKVRKFKMSKINDCSQNDVSPSGSKNFQKLRKQNENGSLNKFDSEVSNWRNSPYPDADCENMKSKYDDLDSQPTENIHYNIKFSDKEPDTTKSENSEEYADEEIVDSYEFPTSDTKNISNESSNNELKEKASIKTFHNIKGKVNKLYSKFAEVKSCNLHKTVSFFWNDFYTDGKSVEEQQLDDLKQVLKIGDNIQFNYFIIVDDSGQRWQKVSLAWIGSKPKTPFEMKPEEFIKQNSLSVTISDAFDIDEVEEDKVTTRKFLNSFIDDVPDLDDKISGNESYVDQFEEDKVTPRKFLTPNIDVLSDPDDKISRSESLTDNDEPLISAQGSTKYSRTVQQDEFLNLSNTISQILKKGMSSADSKVDLQSMSEEIVSTVLKNCIAIKSDGDSYNASNSSQVKSGKDKISDVCSKCRGKIISNFSLQEVTTNDCDVQTLITGEIISLKIFPKG